MENRNAVGPRTGFVNVVEVKGKYQARLQVPGDGRGGSMTRKQHALPGLFGLFDTAEDAAVMLAPSSDEEGHEGAQQRQALCAAEAGQAAHAAQLTARGATACGSPRRSL